MTSPTSSASLRTTERGHRVRIFFKEDNFETSPTSSTSLRTTERGHRVRFIKKKKKKNCDLADLNQSEDNRKESQGYIFFNDNFVTLPTSSWS